MNDSRQAITRSPFLFFVVILSAALLLYALKWSQLYPDYSWMVIILLTIVLLTSLIQIVLDNSRPRIINFSPVVVRASSLELLAVGSLWLLSFIYNRGIPLIQVATDDYTYDIYKFGLPLVHVALLTYTSVLSLRGFAAWLCSRTPYDLGTAAFFPAMAFLIYSRSAMSFFFISAGIVFLSFRRISGRVLLGLATVLAGAVLVFGLLGNSRLVFQVAQANQRVGTMEGMMSSFSEPTDEFYDTGLPLSVMWAYLYLSSPLANLQNIVNLDVQQFFPGDLVVTQFIPDIIGKRLPFYADVEFSRWKYLISPSLTVGTTFFAPFFYGGWFGVYLMWLVILLLWRLLVVFCPFEEWQLLLSAAFGSFLAFSLFDNMLSFSANSLQLFIIVALGVIKRPEPLRSAVGERVADAAS